MFCARRLGKTRHRLVQPGCDIVRLTHLLKQSSDIVAVKALLAEQRALFVGGAIGIVGKVAALGALQPIGIGGEPLFLDKGQQRLRRSGRTVDQRVVDVKDDDFEEAWRGQWLFLLMGDDESLIGVYAGLPARRDDGGGVQLKDDGRPGKQVPCP